MLSCVGGNYGVLLNSLANPVKKKKRDLTLFLKVMWLDKTCSMLLISFYTLSMMHIRRLNPEGKSECM